METGCLWGDMGKSAENIKVIDRWVRLWFMHIFSMAMLWEIRKLDSQKVDFVGILQASYGPYCTCHLLTCFYAVSVRSQYAHLDKD